MSWPGLFWDGQASWPVHPTRKKGRPSRSGPSITHAPPYQKKNRKPNCIIREKFTCDVIRPKELLPNDVLGAANIGVLNAFNASARNCPLNFSRIEKLLNIDTSQLAWPGPRISSAREMLPNVPCGEVENAFLLI